MGIALPVDPVITWSRERDVTTDGVDRRRTELWLRTTGLDIRSPTAAAGELRVGGGVARSGATFHARATPTWRWRSDGHDYPEALCRLPFPRALRRAPSLIRDTAGRAGQRGRLTFLVDVILIAWKFSAETTTTSRSAPVNPLAIIRDVWCNNRVLDRSWPR